MEHQHIFHESLLNQSREGEKLSHYHDVRNPAIQTVTAE
jgi:hypothetical protein